MTSVLEDGAVLTAERLAAEIGRQVTAAVGSGSGGGGSVVAVGGAPRRYIATQRPAGYYSWWTDETSDDQTFGEIRTLLGASGWIRIGLPYDIVDGECSVVSIKMAQTSRYELPFNPVDENGNPVPWVEGTFHNGGDDTTLADQLAAEMDFEGSPVTSITLEPPPVNGTAWAGVESQRKQPGNRWTDWMHVPPHRRTDGGAFNLLLILVKFSGTVAIYRAVGASYDDVSGGRFVRSYVTAGDAATDPANFTSVTRSTRTPGLTVQYIPQTPVVQVMANGDSTEASVTNHVARAVFALSTPQRPIELCTVATGGLAATEYAQKLRPIMRAGQTSIVFLKMWSPNAGTSLADSERGWAENMQLAADVQAAGGVPVLMAPYPNPGRITTAAQEAIRLEMVRRCREAEAAGAKILDLDLLMSNGAVPVAGNKPEFYVNDGTHPEEEGLALIAELATTPLLRSILAEVSDN